MSFYETPRRNASDSTTASNRSTHRGHRREHSDPCPLPSPGLPHKALSTPELLRSKTVGDPCSAIRRSCSSLAALRTGKEPVPPNADGFEELRDGDEFFDNFSWLFVLLAVILRYVWHERHPPPAGDGRGRRLHSINGSYARSIFVMILLKVKKRSRPLKYSPSRQAKREAARKTKMFRQ